MNNGNSPQDELAEQAILANAICQEAGATSRPGEAALKCLGDLTEEEFYSPAHQLLFRAVKSLAEAHQTIDYLTIHQWLAECGLGDRVPASKITELDVIAFPLLGDSHLDEQRHRVRALARRRTTLSEALALAQAVKSGDAQEVAERAQLIGELSKSTRPGQHDLPPAPTCPIVPEAAWRGLASLYRQAVKGTTEASDNFHYFGFLVAAGAGLGKHVFTRMGDVVYPNLYAVLYGRSGRARKGTAMKRAMQLVSATCPLVSRMYSIDSAEGLIEAMKRIKTETESKRDSTVIVTLAELRSLIEKAAQKGLGGIMPMLCDAYDAPPRMETNTKHSRSWVDDPPLLSIFAATSGSYMQELKPKDLEGGLGNRVVWVPGENKGRIPRPPEPDSQLWNPLVSELAEILTYWRDKGKTEIRWSGDAAQRWDDFYMGLESYGADSELIAVLSDRFHHHVLKIALILAALDKSPVIESHHLESAISVADFLLKSLYYIFRSFGVPSWVKEEQEMFAAIERDGPITARDLRRKGSFRKLSLETFHRRIKALTEGPAAPCELCRVSSKRQVLRLRR